MTHNNQDITDYHVGDDMRIEVTVEQDGTAKDITGSSAEYEVYEDFPSGKNIIFTKDTSTDGGISIVDGANGRLDIDIDGADTEDLDGVYSHRLRVTDDTGKTVTAFTGEFEVNT